MRPRNGRRIAPSYTQPVSAAPGLWPPCTIHDFCAVVPPTSQESQSLSGRSRRVNISTAKGLDSGSGSRQGVKPLGIAGGAVLSLTSAGGYDAGALCAK